MGEKFPSALCEDALPETRPHDQDGTTEQLAEELGEAIHSELLEMVRLLHNAQPASLFGLTEVTIRDRALQIAAKAYQPRLKQKKTATTAPA